MLLHRPADIPTVTDMPPVTYRKCCTKEDEEVGCREVDKVNVNCCTGGGGGGKYLLINVGKLSTSVLYFETVSGFIPKDVWDLCAGLRYS